MKIIIFSDSHGITSKMQEVLKLHKDIDLIIHLGDLVKDALYLKDNTQTPVKYVKGNCDGVQAPSEILEEINGIRLLAVHGHRQGVKGSLDKLFYEAKEKKAKIVLFGHTHIPYYETEQGIIFINPGSIGEKRWLPNESYSIINIDNNNIDVYMREYISGAQKN